MDSIYLVSCFLILQYPWSLETSYVEDNYVSSLNKQQKIITKTCNDYRRRLNSQRTVTVLKQLSVLPPEWKLTKSDPDPLGEIYNYAFQALLIHLFCPKNGNTRVKTREEGLSYLQGSPSTDEPVTMSTQCTEYGRCEDIIWD